MRTYTGAIRDGAIFVDVDVEATAAGARAASEALVAALETGRPTLAARRCARLLDLGAGVDHVARLLVRYGATHADAGLDPETAAVADALAAAARLPPGQSRYLFADVAAALAERLARAAPRFGPEPRPRSRGPTTACRTRSRSWSRTGTTRRPRPWSPGWWRPACRRARSALGSRSAWRGRTAGPGR